MDEKATQTVKKADKQEVVPSVRTAKQRKDERSQPQNPQDVEVGQRQVKSPAVPSTRLNSSTRKKFGEDATQFSSKTTNTDHDSDSNVVTARQLEKVAAGLEHATTGTDLVITESGNVQKGDQSKNAREHFSSTFTYLLTTIGCAVGLGNVWRFPAEAASNGGIVFMIPYFTCTFLIGIPLLYFEAFIGQFTQKGNGECFYLYMPAAAGIGIAQYILVFLLAAFYYVITGWSFIYLIFIVLEDHQRWTRCDNWWNTAACRSNENNRDCGPGNVFVKGDGCLSNTTLSLMNMKTAFPAQELLVNYIWEAEEGPFTLGMNPKMLVIMAFLWLIAFLVAWKGVKLMGYVSYFTTITPYVVVVILCIFGFTREGFTDGFEHFIWKADFSKLWDPKVWGAAFAQMCLSLSLGYGAHPTLGSFNPRGHNALRDACIIIAADTMMSLLGGLAMFSFLGDFAHQKGMKVSEVMEKQLSAGPMLAFVVYPEAVSAATFGWFWSLLFFLMLFLLGFSTIIVATKILATAFTDAFPRLEKRAQLIQLCVVISLYIAGLPIMSKSAGGWVGIYDFSVSSFAIFLLIFAEIVVCYHCYGIRRFRNDLRTIYGEPRGWSMVCGSSGYYFLINWLVITPLVALGMTGFMFYSKIMEIVKEGQEGQQPPVYAEVVRWFLLCLILLCLPLMALIQVLIHHRRKKSWKSAFRPHALHPTFHKPSNLPIVSSQRKVAATKDVQPIVALFNSSRVNFVEQKPGVASTTLKESKENKNASLGGNPAGSLQAGNKSIDPIEKRQHQDMKKAGQNSAETTPIRRK